MRAGNGGREIEHAQPVKASCRIPLIDLWYGHRRTPLAARLTASLAETLEAAGLGGNKECRQARMANPTTAAYLCSAGNWN
jgi:hypothetical protein